MGLHAQDTAELHFENVRVPVANLLGKEGTGFYHLMTNLPSERLAIAISAIAGARETWRQTLQYVKDRKAFGQPIGSFQHNRFLLAEMDTELEIAEQYIDRCLRGVVDGDLTAVEAAKAKWWCTETGKKVVDGCVQLHGGYGYMMEYRVARDYVDSRIQTIFGGTTEIMKGHHRPRLGSFPPVGPAAASDSATGHRFAPSGRGASGARVASGRGGDRRGGGAAEVVAGAADVVAGASDVAVSEVAVSEVAVSDVVVGDVVVSLR